MKRRYVLLFHLLWGVWGLAPSGAFAQTANVHLPGPEVKFDLDPALWMGASFREMHRTVFRDGRRALHRQWHLDGAGNLVGFVEKYYVNDTTVGWVDSLDVRCQWGDGRLVWRKVHLAENAAFYDPDGDNDFFTEGGHFMIDTFLYAGKNLVEVKSLAQLHTSYLPEDYTTNCRFAYDPRDSLVYLQMEDREHFFHYYESGKLWRDSFPVAGLVIGVNAWEYDAQGRTVRRDHYGYRPGRGERINHLTRTTETTWGEGKFPVKIQWFRGSRLDSMATFAYDAAGRVIRFEQSCLRLGLEEDLTYIRRETVYDRRGRRIREEEVNRRRGTHLVRTWRYRKRGRRVEWQSVVVPGGAVFAEGYTRYQRAGLPVEEYRQGATGEERVMYWYR
ncbi:MAG: hypothetical protein AAF998_28365 [Bacteroidota bacterium]